MASREATCHCGQLRVTTTADPFVVSICHCTACQRRTGSAFGMQAAFRPDQVEVTGRYRDYTRISDEADRKEDVFHFCPDCGSQVFGTEPTAPDVVVVSVGAFADPAFPAPTESVYDHRRHRWLELPESRAGQVAEAVALLRQAIDAWEGFREMARDDDDFDAIRDDPGFRELIGP